MECSAKPQVLRGEDIKEDFLWCGEIPGIKRGRSQKAFWKDMQAEAAKSSGEWHQALESMARFECKVEVKSKPGARYEYIPAEAEPKSRARVANGKSVKKAEMVDDCHGNRGGDKKSR